MTNDATLTRINKYITLTTYADGSQRLEAEIEEGEGVCVVATRDKCETLVNEFFAWHVEIKNAECLVLLHFQIFAKIVAKIEKLTRANAALPVR